MSDTSFDLIVIGSGPGGYVAAIRAAKLDLNVALVEKDPHFGGTCLHRGCIPTKALLKSADLLSQTKKAADFGVTTGDVGLDFAKVQARKASVVENLAKGVAFLVKKNKITPVTGFGALAGPGKVKVTDAGGKTTLLSAAKIVLATGSAPRDLPHIQADGRRILNSDHILEMKSVPKSLVVLGSGAVGTEFASVFSRFGTEVTLVELLDRIVPLEDAEVSRELARNFKKQKIRVLTSTKASAAQASDSFVQVVVEKQDGSKETLEAEYLLLATGRRPLTENIGLETVGITAERGYIPVSDYCETSAAGVYAIGDIVNTPWLAHVASAEGIVAVEHAAGHPTRPVDYDRIPGCTYCHPEIASVGLTEEQAKEAGYTVKAGKFSFSALGKAQIEGEKDGFIKIVSEEQYGEVLGVHIIGPHATELIAEACVLLAGEFTLEELGRIVHAHPTVAEGVLEAAHLVSGHPIHS